MLRKLKSFSIERKFMNHGNIPGKPGSVIEKIGNTYFINMGGAPKCSVYRFCKAASHYPTCEDDSIGLRACFDPNSGYIEMMKKRGCGGCGGDDCG